MTTYFVHEYDHYINNYPSCWGSSIFLLALSVELHFGTMHLHVVNNSGTEEESHLLLILCMA